MQQLSNEESFYMGVDPSTVSTGWAVFNQNGELVDYGVIRTDDELPMHKRLLFQYDALKVVIGSWNITHMLCEDQFSRNNIDTLKKLSQTRGMVMLVAAENTIEFDLATPSQWRKIYLGKGNATKRDCVKQVNEQYGLSLKMAQNDIAEAIGIGAACVQRWANNTM